MSTINLDLPRRALILHASIAALAAVGITTLAGADAQAIVGIPVLTALITVALLSVSGERKEAVWREEEEPATTDRMTGLTTEEVARDALAREFAAAQRGRPLTIALIQLEELSKYRARYGDAVADQLVRVAGRTLVRHRRGMHLAAPHGDRPGTFMSILSGVDQEGGAVYAARLRGDLMQLDPLPAHEGVSIGVASFDMSMTTPGELLRRAAFALEKGVQAGGKVMVVGQRAEI